MLLEEIQGHGEDDLKVQKPIAVAETLSEDPKTSKKFCLL
jgi:hypothetical protein